MSGQRSALLTTFGILHLIGGGLGLLCSLAVGFLTLVISSAPAGADPNNLAQQIRTLQIDKVPSFQTVEVLRIFLWLFLDVLLLISGMGLLMRQTWARWASLFYAVLSILSKIFLAIFYFGVVYPHVNTFLNTYVAPTQQGQTPGFLFGLKIGTFGSACFNSVLILYPIAVLIAFAPPSAAESFAPIRRRRRRLEDEEEEDD